MEPVVVGIIGCGNISPIYFANLRDKFSRYLTVKGAVDLIPERLQAAQERFAFPVAYASDAELLADPQIELVLNITQPSEHYKLCRMALEAGKNVYVEKPLSLERAQGKELVELAARKGLLLGCAPDTFLGGGLQTCRRAIDEGLIGDPVGCTAFMLSRGCESWHPDPAFYYQYGGGPMLDMGPYYLTALVNLLGPVQSVSGATRISFAQRTITTQKNYGAKIDVEVPTYVAGLLNFHSGIIGTIITSFDVWATSLPPIEIYGSEGTLLVPDPNTFGGPVRYKRPGDEDWQQLPLLHGYQDNSRGVGLADMAVALRTGRKHRANALAACHVLDCMLAMEDSCRQGISYRLSTACERAEPLPQAADSLLP